jgi:DUF971 family protein
MSITVRDEVNCDLFCRRREKRAFSHCATCSLGTILFHCYAAGVRPLDIQRIGNELAVKWEDGDESFISMEQLRRSCPCATCKGEVDILGNLYKNPDAALPASAFELLHFTMVGGYAIQPVWGDGHATGIYSFDYLRKVATSE